jgi:hypothetical protein
MDVGLDQARDDQPAIEDFFGRIGRNARLDRRDPTVLEPDIEPRAGLIGEASAAQDEVEHGYCAASARPR